MFQVIGTGLKNLIKRKVMIATIKTKRYVAKGDTFRCFFKGYRIDRGVSSHGNGA